MITKIRWYTTLLLGATMAAQMLSSCDDDDKGLDSSSNPRMRFEVTSQGTNTPSRAYMLTEDTREDSLVLIAQVRDIDDSLSAPTSRGVLNDDVSDFLLTCVRVSDDSDESMLGYYFQGEEYDSNGDNANGNIYYWLNTGKQKYKFYGMGPADMVGTAACAIDYAAADGTPSISFTVPTNADDQFDLKGVATDFFADTYQNTVPLSFKHLCTAITFSADKSIFPGTIREVSISGIYGSATYDMGTGTWSAYGDISAYSKDLNKEVNKADHTVTPAGEATFFLLPQTLPDGAKVTVEYVNSVTHAPTTLTADLSGMEWPIGKVINFQISTSGLTAYQVGLHIEGHANPDLLPAKATLSLVGDAVNLLPATATVDDVTFDLMAPDFIDAMIEKGCMGTNVYTITLTSAVDPTATQELLVEYTFDYMAYTVNVDDTSKAVPLPFYPMGEGNYTGSGKTPGETPSTLMVRWAPGTYTDEFDQVTTANRYYTYSTTGTRQIRIYSNLEGETAVPEYRFVAGENFPAQTVSVDTKLLSAPNGQLSLLFLDCKKLISVPANLFVEFTGRNVTSCVGTFQSCQELSTVPAGLLDPLTQVTDFGRLFQSCRKLTTIPAKLFDNCVEAVSMNQLFNDCRMLSAIPHDLFKYNTKATTFANAFQNCWEITEIPEHLFDNCPEVLNFSYTFQTCKKLASIPGELFKYNTKVTEFNNTFQGDAMLASIPGNLFATCTEVKTFSYTFHTCTTIPSVPAELFANCTKAEKFDLCFCGCTSLTTIYSELFQSCRNTAKTFSGVFMNTGVTAAPAGLFANMEVATDFDRAFQNCSNLSSIAPDLFQGCTKAYYMQQAFQKCTSLTSIPPEIFSDCSNAYDFTSTFEDCTALQAIPATLFQGCVNASNFTSTFRNCGSVDGTLPGSLFANVKKENITDFNSTFASCYTLKGPIPADLFKGFSNITSLTRTFYECRSLNGPLPAELFAGMPKLTTLNYTFAYAHNVNGLLPSELFANNPELQSVEGAFLNCFITGIPLKIFDNNPRMNNFAYTFDRCYALSGKVPELWNKFPGAQHTDCFNLAGTIDGEYASSITNWNDIPEDWK